MKQLFAKTFEIVESHPPTPRAMSFSSFMNEAGKSSERRNPKIGGRGFRVLVGGDFCERSGVVSQLAICF